MEGAPADTARYPGSRVAPWSFPLLVLAVGLFVTLGFAITKQEAAIRERGILFDARVERIGDDLTRAVGGESAELQSAINFISATHPSPINQYERFLEADSDIGLADQNEDLSVLFIEPVDPADVDVLVDRERRLGQPDFSVFSLGRPPGQPHLVVTRTVSDLEVLGFPARGLDLSLARQTLVPGPLPMDGIEIWGLESSRVLGSISPESPINPNTLDEGFSTALVTLVGPVADANGSVIGWALSFINLSDLHDEIDLPAGVHASFRLDGIDTDVLALGGPVASDALALEETTRRQTGSLGWTITVGADRSFGPGTGLLDQTRTWWVGLLITFVVTSAALSRQVTKRRLDVAAFELEHARTLASTDSLTGLLNRMGFVDSTRTVDAAEPATLFFVDLDGFKAVNDRAGHEAGDVVLRDVASAVRSVFRPDDLVGRLGGDEFVIFTPGTTGREYEREICARIIDSISELDVGITCSIGVAARAAGLKTDIKTLMRTADEAMYEAKRSGGARSTLSH